MDQEKSTHNYNQLSKLILKEYDEISKEFSHFQVDSKLTCITGCGKCCFKPDIYCSPIELLPMALQLLKSGEAEKYLELSLSKQDERCVFLNVSDERSFKASCSQYAFRPLVCRTFGVSARHFKNGKIDFSVCKTLKDNKPEEFNNLIQYQENLNNVKLPFIDLCKSRLVTLDPQFLDSEFPINKSLRIILEKILYLSSLYDFTQEL